jgi:hypothetical protein
MPKDEPMAANPPSGAYIDDVLKSAPAAPFTLEILDDHETLVPKFSSSDAIPQPNLACMTTAPEWFTPPSSLASTPGMHRFVWNLRIPARDARAASSPRRESIKSC